MQIFETPIQDLLEIQPKVFGDKRGFFLETWQKKRYEEAGIHYQFVQDNRSFSSRGTLRGLHFQKRFPQGKLVSVIFGEVFDVAVDLRRGSNTYGNWFGLVLSAEKCNQLWIPPGFAHGFYVLSETAFFEYKCTDYYHPEDEAGILWNDKDIGVDWPIPPASTVLLSEKDRNGLPFKEISFSENTL